ncbi:hypothetical protein BGZ98_004770, partial [Dissophora globulifera]
TVELGYGTPYLLSLGIPKSLTALVWLAGPLSGLVIQPVVGVFSDSLDWKLGRRRPFILIGATLTAMSMYMVAYAHALAELVVGHWQGNTIVEDEEAYAAAIKGWTIGFAVAGFYCLDFSINAVQASCRSLIMDIPPTYQQEVCNAWSGWMNNLGSVVGFFAGNLDLVKYFSPWLGDSQIKILANLAMIFFASCLTLSCMSVKEIQYVPTEEDKKRSVWSTLGNIWKAFRKLPAEIQRICNVQFFAWMGWFPFLFYSTTWVGEILHRYQVGPSRPGDDDTTVAERAGSFALLCWAGVAVVCGILIPKITPQEIGIETWPRNPFTLKNLWTISLVWFAICMGMTWFVDDLWAATGVIALCGVPWAVAMWIPFAMVGEIISDMKDRLESRERRQSSMSIASAAGGGVLRAGAEGYGTMSPISTLENNDSTSQRQSSLTATVPVEGGGNEGEDEDEDEDEDDSCALIGGNGLTDSELEAVSKKSGPYLDAGLVLGVHNMYIVFPQFADAIIASCLFAMIGSVSREEPTPQPAPIPGPGDGDGLWWMEMGSAFRAFAGDPEPVGWVLRFGGVMALVAAYLTRRL